MDGIRINENSLDFKKDLKKIYLKGSLPAKLYGLPKVRPVLSIIVSPNHLIVKVLNKYLKHFVENKYASKDVLNFSREINDLYVTHQV